MRYIVPLLLVFGLAGCAYPYGYDGYAYNSYPAYNTGYAYAPTYYQPNYAYQPSYAQAYSSENCGTPYEWKACTDRWYRRY